MRLRELGGSYEENSAPFIRIDLRNSITPDLFEWILRPFWAEEYAKDPGAPGIPSRLVQFLDTRSKAMARLETELGISQEHGAELGLEEFLRLYETRQLPIRCPYKVSDITVVETIV